MEPAPEAVWELDSYSLLASKPETPDARVEADLAITAPLQKLPTWVGHIRALKLSALKIQRRTHKPQLIQFGRQCRWRYH